MEKYVNQRFIQAGKDSWDNEKDQYVLFPENDASGKHSC